MATDKVKVAVRVRPMNRREVDLAAKCIVNMDTTQTVLFHPKDSIQAVPKVRSPSQDIGESGGRKAPKTFAFDHCFWSMDEKDPKFVCQAKVFECLGRDILKLAYEGYNGCIFAYGQTGSGKSYTMMGTADEKGIIPRLCDALFEKIATNDDPDLTYKVEVSYMEIYNEKVHDLLDPKGGKQNLRVREHNILGPYVDGLSTLVVSSFEDIDNLMNEGNKSRTVAATNMNSESSRSHAVFNIIVTQTLVDSGSMVKGEKVSKLSLVDLAGSERAQKTGAVGERLKEGSNINKSLTTLGLVISALADQAAGKNKNKFVPYRDSVLTWLLKDNLGGNSKTVMVATVSPAADNYEETLSTLRYADRAKRIINHAVVNEDPNARIIRELREEVVVLRNQLSEAQSMKAPDLKDRLEESEKLIKEMTKTWEEKLAETEKIHQERHKALENMGISVQTSGIKVEQSRFYLVNLNADPSLNELLVYYLKEHTLVGRTDAAVQQDIHLSGLGIMPEHCIVDFEGNDVYLTPLEGARTCVNGSVIHQKTKVRNGDRILWGNNHFFRINLPRPNNTLPPLVSEPEQHIDYDFAQQELMMKELSNDPIQEAICAIEKQYEEDKQEALERQKQMYERQMQMLRSQLVSPSTPSFPFPSFDLNRMTPGNSTQSSIQRKYQQWAQERCLSPRHDIVKEKLFKQSLAKLREEVIKANTLVREANDLAQEMGRQTEFHVTLQIPAANLSPNRRRGAFVSEPAILVKRKYHNSQIWSMEKFENKIIDMRELYDENKTLAHPLMVLEESDDYSKCNQTKSSTHSVESQASKDGNAPKGDPFYESQENHNLIGVANVFLECLFYDVKLDYHVPIISQQGEIAGKLHVEISKLGGSLIDKYSDVSSEGSDYEPKRSSLPFDSFDEDSNLAIGAPLYVRISIREARGLPAALSNFVFCQYSFWGQLEPIVVAPLVNPEYCDPDREDGATVTFSHTKDFKVCVTEEFIEHASEGALSIEVWGHRSPGFSNNNTWDPDNRQARSRSLLDRWNEVMRKIEFWVEVHELNEQGEYTPVEVVPKPEVPSAGVFQLRQGHSRRVMVRVKPVANSGTLPLICESIVSISIGCICVRSKLQKGLDSYQEEDLNLLGERWSDALMRRKAYLAEQFQKLINKQDKNEAEVDRETSLVEQWIGLTEERNAVLVPAAGSGIPGAPADSETLPDMEQHVPVLFLDLNADDMSTPSAKEGLQAAGINSILPKEHGAKFYSLPIIKTYGEKDICAIASWDSSIHDSQYLNRVTPSNERVYLILKAIVRLSHPASMELVLRKRLCINIYKKQGLTSITDKLKKRITRSDLFLGSGVTYEVVSNIPKASEDLENMETLAQMAASQNETNAADGETYIEKYIKGVSAVESILTLDRLRQEVAVKELLSASGRSLRKTTSVPNIHQAMVSSPPRIDDQLRADSIQDLSFQELYTSSSSHKSGNSSYAGESMMRKRAFSEVGANIANAAKEGGLLTRRRSVGLARPNFLNLRSNTQSNTAKRTFKLLSHFFHHDALLGQLGQWISKPPEPTPKSTISPHASKAVKPLRTLQEEQQQRERKPLLQQDTEEDFDEDFDMAHKHSIFNKDPNSVDSDDFQEFESYQSQHSSPFAEKFVAQRPTTISHSVTADSLMEIQTKSFTPSMTSSGYGSQAVSTLTLSSEDSVSIRSINLDEASAEGKNSPPKTFPTPLSDQGLESIPDKAPMKSFSLDSIADQAVSAARLADLINGNIVSDNNEQDESDFSYMLNQSNDFSDTLQSTVDNHRSSKSTLMDLDSSSVNETTMNPASHPCQDQDQEYSFKEEDYNSQVLANATKNLNLSSNFNDTSEMLHSRRSPLEGSNSLHDMDYEMSSPQGQSTPLKKTQSVDDNELDSSTSLSHSCDWGDSYNETTEDDLNKICNTLHNMDTDNKQCKQAAAKGNSNQPVNRKLLTDSSTNINSNMTDNPKKSTSKSESKSYSANSLERKNNSDKRTVEGHLKRNLSHGSAHKRRPVSCSLPSGSEITTSCSMKDLSYQNMNMSTSNETLSGGEDSMSLCSFGSRADLDRLHEGPLPTWIQQGEGVIVTSSKGYSKPGVVQFIGTVHFASGIWIGVELDNPEGKNDGSVNGSRYFKCRSKHGIFVRHDKLIWDKRRRSTKKNQSGLSSYHASNRRSLGSLTAVTGSIPLSRSSSNLSAAAVAVSVGTGNGTTSSSLPSTAGTSPSSFMRPTSASSAKRK
ncbi:kinesin-like protein KIF13A isoform X8 [Octopus sinensis]|uniref:Kinesin-like protein KIF13A isoform X8 n=1 Tax=Octopus sinensis TaxID=2607531 RepID=A0A7E6ESM3_9MOLL|nr:kinesin-like protein KIF13A isoform X8 [Octopus sinensis]